MTRGADIPKFDQLEKKVSTPMPPIKAKSAMEVRPEGGLGVNEAGKIRPLIPKSEDAMNVACPSQHATFKLSVPRAASRWLRVMSVH